MESVEEEAFEVQVLQPFHGWVFERFCDRSGNSYAELSRAAARVTWRDDRLNGIPETPKLEVGVLRSPDWMWGHAWLPDVEYTQCDEEGWSYGSSIARINCRLAEGTSKVKRGYCHFLRRRRWIRTRIRTPLSLTHAAGDANARSSCGTPVSAVVEGDSDDEKNSRVSEPREAQKRYYRVYRDALKAYFQLGSTHRAENFVRVEFTDEDLAKEGWLGVRGSLSRSWKLRYFLLRWDSSSLVCLRDRASMVQVSEELIDRHTTLLVEESNKPRQFQFSVCNGERAVRLNAVDGTSRASWISALSEMIVRSRASFYAGEDSEGGSSTRSRSLRRMRSSTEDDGSIVSASMVSEMNGAGNNGSGGKTHHHRGAWRPYKFLSSTMQSKHDTDKACRRDYVDKFTAELQSKVELAKSLVTQNVNILEENMCAAQEFLTSAVASVPKKDIQEFRQEATQAFQTFRASAKATLADSGTNVLACNALLKELYALVARLQEKLHTLAPIPVHATIKKTMCESPTKRRIPVDWFTDSPHVEKDKTKPSLSEESTLSTGTSNSTVGKLDLSYTSGSSLEVKRSGKRSQSVPESNRVSTTPSNATPLSSHAPTTSETIKVKPYIEIPEALCEGHFELPDGINGYVVKVHDKDIGSLIGYTLCSTQYVDQLEEQFEHTVDIAEELRASEGLGESETAVPSPPQSENNSNSVSAMPNEELMPPPAPASSRSDTAAAEAAATIPAMDAKRAIYLSKLRSSDLQHTDMKFSYEAGSTNHEFRCVAFFAAQFHALRALTLPGNVEFLNSVVESKRWETSGGKSGAFFSMTHDKRYVLKGISVTEFNMFVHMAPRYFKFISRVVEFQTPTIITKIVGLFKLNHSRRLLKHTEYVVVMENFSYGFPPGQMYDLKGILRRRYNAASSGEEDHDDFFNSVSKVQVSMSPPVLLDGNLLESIPVPVTQPDLDVIEAAILNDTGFLYRAGVIDYSLLLRFDENKRQVVVGLIDYLHQFDFLKKMESTSKASLMFRNPTVISPISYRRRFVNAMNRYFVGIERELEVRMRKRAATAKPRLQHPPGTSASEASTAVVPDKRAASVMLVLRERSEEQSHADEAARLARNMSISSNERQLPPGQRPAAKSEICMPRTESEWTSSMPRGHSMSHICSDHEACCSRALHSEGEYYSSPCSSSGVSSGVSPSVKDSSTSCLSREMSPTNAISEQHAV